MNNINDIQRYNNLVMEIMCEPEFKPGGFVYKHLEENKSDPLVSIKSAVDRMSELYDLERNDIGIVSELILEKFKNK
tara:strand:- start:1198 stop:1428 length:231 start_codon:yes stop_codon:yes gene_type:complete